MKTIQFVKVNNVFHAINTHVDYNHLDKVLIHKAVMTVAKKRGWI